MAALMALWVTAPLFAAPLSQAGTLRFAPLPMQDRETLFKQFQPLAVFLEARLQVAVSLDYSDNYSEILDKMSRSKVDLAYIGPLPYVELRARYPHVEPLVRFREASGATAYTCALAAFPDNFFDPYLAHDRRVALTQPLSTCGYLSVEGLLRGNGLTLKNNRYRYLGKHDAVALAVIRGEFDAGGLKTGIARKYAHLGLEIIEETDPLPAFAMVANTRTVSAQRRDEIRRALIDLDPAGKDRALLSGWGDNIRHGAVAASDDDYDVIRALLGNARIPSEGNH